MPNISSDSSVNEGGFPKVEVLLATFNGESYLHEFLTSLASQRRVEINLIVSDDGSSDSTLEILDYYAEAFQSMTILKGPGKGPAQNFLWLLHNSTSDFVALADQDDIWYPEKLISGIDEMSFAEGPLLHISALNILNGPILKNQPYRIPISILRNRTQGCTMLINKEFLLIIQKLKFENIIMHDWAILLVAQMVGSVIFSSKSQMAYRIHEGNFIGLTKYNERALRYLRMLGKRRSNLHTYNQIKEIYEQLRIFGVNSIEVESFIEAVQGNFIARTIYVLLERKIFLSSPGNFLSALKIIRGSYF